ncbi:MAG: Bax inhibitor-1/YccA family protein [Deltaproteobacteria bacterium]|nr:Bax inhibitor-1/YccA family protein [Deltaproteobacteria bacterium]
MTADDRSVAAATLAERSEFIHRTYQHLALAIAAFIGIEALLLSIPGIESFIAPMISSRIGWLVVLGAFMGVSYVADRWASTTTSRSTQYMGLGLYIVAEAVVFLPLLYYAAYIVGGDVLIKATVTTGVVFGGLTATVLLSKRDFSFLGGILRVAGFGALGLIAVSLIFGFSLGSIFAGAMAVFAAGTIVYSTSNVLHRYRPDQHVAASLSLFASVALLFWYILSLFLGSRR